MAECIHFIKAESKAVNLKRLERYQESEVLFLEVREDTRKLFTEEHPVYSRATAELSALYHDKGRFSEVEIIYLEAIAISLQISGVGSLNYVLQINNLARLLAKIGEHEESQQLVELINPVFQANKRSNQQNNITAIANLIGLNSGSCGQIKQRIEDTLPGLERLSATSWRRMHSELWLGELALRCAH